MEDRNDRYKGLEKCLSFEAGWWNDRGVSGSTHPVRISLGGLVYNCGVYFNNNNGLDLNIRHDILLRFRIFAKTGTKFQKVSIELVQSPRGDVDKTKFIQPLLF